MIHLARRYLTRLRRRLLPARLDLVYSEDYPLDVPGVPYDPHRGEHILTFLAAEDLARSAAVHRPYPASFKQLARVHGEEYLDALQRPGGLTRIVGLKVADEIHDRFLEIQRLMVAGTVLAVRLALRRHRAAANLGGGLHHAHAGRGQGFCVFNDVAVAIAEARRRGFAEPILVIDLDLHDGDGTRALFADDPSVHTFSICNRFWDDTTAVASTDIELGDQVGDAAYLETLSRHLPPVFEEVNPGLVIYLAGCDPAQGDEIGDWRITAEGMLERDRFVFELARGGGRDTPLAVLLGGGYGPEAWRYSARFLAWIASGGHRLEPPTTGELTLDRYRHLARLLHRADLTGGEEGGEWDLSDEDLLGALGSAPRQTRFLGYYSRQGIELVLERAGILERLRNLGFRRLRLEMDLDNPSGHTVRVVHDGEEREVLGEMRARRDRLIVPGLEMLYVEWLLLQNPRASFPPERPPLPGQKHPGLGMLRDAVALMVLICERLELDGMCFVPAHYHLAAQARGMLVFFEPEHEALFRALHQTLDDLPLAEALRALEEGHVVHARTGEPFPWRPMLMVLPVSERLCQRLQCAEFEERVAAHAERWAFELRR